MDSSEFLILCSSQPGFLRCLGGKLVGKCRLLECYSLTEAGQMIQMHEPRIAIIDLRNASGQRFDRAFAMAQNSATTFLVIVTHERELTQSGIPIEITDRVVHLQVDRSNASFDETGRIVEEILQDRELQSSSSADGSTNARPDSQASPVYQLEAHALRFAPPDRVPSKPERLSERYRTRTPALRSMLDRLEIAAQHDVTMLLIGETGSGKTHLAQLIHESSSRAGEPFVTVACGALPGELIESELFGHVKGAFTSAHTNKDGKFLAAGRGTILLDEIDVLTPEQQVKLLRVIEQGLFEAVGSNHTLQVDARIIAASNLELQPLVEQGRFRPDLYYRLNTLCFTIPPLRERLPDIEPLARYFVHLHAESHRVEVHTIHDNFIECLIQYPWPGNVREMENAIRSAVIYSSGGHLKMETLPPNVVSGAAGPASDPSVASFFGGRVGKSLGNRIQHTEKDIIEQALLNNNYSRTKTARHLGISRVTLYNKMKKYGMMPAK